jgi:dienelactone hydrolase
MPRSFGKTNDADYDLDRRAGRLRRSLPADGGAPHTEDAQLDLTVYPGAYHAFDVRELQPGREVPGYWFEYNGPAATHAWGKVRTFLQKNLGDASTEPDGH